MEMKSDGRKSAGGRDGNEVRWNGRRLLVGNGL